MAESSQTTQSAAPSPRDGRSVTLSQPSVRNMFIGLAPSIVINGVLPIILTNVLLGRGVKPVYALVAGAIFPLLDALVSIARTRQVGFLSVLSLTFIVIGAVSSLLSGDARFTLAKNSFFTGVFGLVFLATLIMGKPLMFSFGRQFATGGNPEKITYWDSLWQYPTFRHSQYVMTTVWGISFALEALVRIVLVYAFPIPVNVMQIISEVMSYAVFALLMGWTFAYGKAVRAKGEREGAARRERSAPTAP